VKEGFSQTKPQFIFIGIIQENRRFAGHKLTGRYVPLLYTKFKGQRWKSKGNSHNLKLQTSNIENYNNFLRFDFMNLSLEGKNAIICGSTQGIGLAIAEELALLGANCTLIARNENALQSAVHGLDSSLRQQHNYLVADFNEPVKLKALIEGFLNDRPVHILINNTGGPPGGPITEASEEAFLSTFNQHLVCNHILAKAVVPAMKKEGYGRIINIISTSVKIPLKNLGVSNTIRGAVASWAKTMANELGEYNITVNNVLPGFTNTQRLATLIENMAKKGNVVVDVLTHNMKQEVPMKRFAEAAEIAAVAAFLASPAASYVNGVSIPVDGGRTGSI
jgi:3-oxoacyl-[acyl-carrier protein] reductase